MLNTRDVDVATWDGIYQILGCLDVVGFGCSELGGSGLRGLVSLTETLNPKPF